ncbi:GGDEF domain-containing protein [Variovorax sp. J22G21]|uniref:GGDEF domain-containing protein n=1 Tax=Variovorax fucosicus TaxID=3053517 RepID=UPI002574B543|nr:MULTISPECIES: GGDEF domain-containing protein [unclassified Variovorax]MDM0037940.1 GGDEF domain-containing protein [Variovorax sp. J22R193]MDM0062716.1 GGDEF domain-containing protein [Variovorax sp. J22G21]
MRQIRLCWNEHVQHADHEIHAHHDWTTASPEVRHDLAIIAKTANELYGPRSHWVEEREVRQPSADPRLRFDQRVLQDDAAAGPYARHLATGVGSLRFQPDLEQEYMEHLRDVQRRPASTCVTVALFGWIVFGQAGLIALSTGSLSADGIASLVQWAMVLVLCAGLLLLMARGRAARTDVVSATVLVLAAATLGLLAVRAGTDARPQVLLAALGLMVVVFFPLGLVFRHALVLGLAMAVGGTVLVFGLSPPALRTDGYLALTALWGAFGLSAVGGYLVERLYREQFLLHGLLSRQAFVDPLTGLYTRRGTHKLTQIARLQAVRDGVNLCFVLADVDRFRAYNERYGREAGDRALIDITQVVATFARRPLDLASREGGKRFGLLLYDCNLEQARLHAEHLRERLRDVGMAHAKSNDPAAQLTVSIGAIQVLPEETAEVFMQRVEAMLQRSKDAGRDRVTTP